MNSTVKTRLLKLAIKKCRRFSDTNQWCGYLTSAEVVVLVEAGAIPTNSLRLAWVERAKENMKRGVSKNVWFYFYPNGLKMIDSLQKH